MSHCGGILQVPESEMFARRDLVCPDPTRRPSRSVTVHGLKNRATKLAAPAFVAVIFVASLWLYTRSNDFPVWYHEDEPTKAWQVVSNTRNYTHPQLMLEVTQLASAGLHTPKDEQATVMVGRDVSASFAAIAMAAMAVLGFRLARWPGLLLCGAAVALCPALLVHAHYMKEDATLVGGLCLAVLACRLAWERRRRPVDFPSLWFLGGACALAVSGKYAGAFVLLAAVPLVCFGGSPGWRWAGVRLIVFLLSFALVLVVVNHRAFDQPSVLLPRFRSEVRHAATGHLDLTMSRPNLYHAVAFVRQCMPHVLVLAGAFVLLAVFRRPRKERAWDSGLVLFTVGYLAAVSFSKLPYYRYVLPVVVLAHFCAAAAVLRLSEHVEARWRALVISAGAAVIVLFQLPRCFDYTSQFADDSRERLRAWIARNLPSDAVFIQDEYLGLDQPFDPRTGIKSNPEIRIYGGTPAPANGNLDHLRAIGVEYVAVLDTEYNRYLDPNLRPAPDSFVEYAYRRHWYQDLFRTGNLVWASVPKHPTYSFFNNPEIRLYKLRPIAGE